MSSFHNWILFYFDVIDSWAMNYNIFVSLNNLRVSHAVQDRGDISLTLNSVIKNDR